MKAILQLIIITIFSIHVIGQKVNDSTAEKQSLDKATAAILSNSIYSQSSNKEFEGVITYKTTIVPKNKHLDLDELYKIFGKERQFYFKAGKFKWVPQNVKLEYEIYNPAIYNSFIIDKFHTSDTLFYKDMSKIPDSVISVKKSKQLTILNIPCSSAIFTVTNEREPNSKLFRTIYYPTDSLKYVNSYFDNFKAMGQGFIARYTNAIPLRMELDSKEQPFSIIYEATNIQWKELADSEFLVDEKLPVKK
ncbi:hypothetical protein FAM09_15280 [Niastella caeni]|uniref:Outer membrane lipoprotein-sorting protein n=1 Tax=Niastella caeni TaxID=2569763 RepID=A0A4S8HRX8_9BACT|nr:hypothetical protein [Niastella caeni]THU38045.1 hypothetical protein FAM09_15280 [Niastella caeni]